MKKFSLLATTLLFSVFSFAYEYTNDQHCIYRIDVERQTATVVNFCSQSSSVTIPESFTYKGDIYTVTKIDRSYKDISLSTWSYYFDEKYASKYGHDDYEDNRASIVELKLPASLEQIGRNAFDDMTRLKSLIIPKNVKAFDASCFGGNSRLESIIIMGFPCCEFSMPDTYKSYERCLRKVSNHTQVLDSLQIALRSSCPKLQKIEILPLKDYLFYKDKLSKSHKAYSKKLNDSISTYKTMLTSHPYYFEDTYFNEIAISEPVLPASNAKDSYTFSELLLKKDYNNQLSLCRKEYKKLWDNMEQNCKQKYPYTYANRYCTHNPEFSARIDTLLKDYKCDYTKPKLALVVLENAQLGEKCQDRLWRQYAYLYQDKETFLAAYDISSDINLEISEREMIYNTLKNQIKNTPITTKGFYDLDNSKHPTISRDFRFNYDNMKKHGISVSLEIINQDPKAQKEFEKNGQYFTSPDEFFAAYITSNYRKILKANKKESNIQETNKKESNIQETNKKEINIPEDAFKNMDKEDIIESQKMSNDCYIAYLIKTNFFKQSANRSVLETLCDNSHIQKLIKKYDARLLKECGKYHNKKLDVYIK